MWFYAPGYFDESGRDIDNMRQLTGIRIVEAVRPSGPVHVMLAGDPPAGAGPQPLLEADPFVVADSDAEIVGVRSDDSQKVVIARRRLPDWTSVYTATAPLSAPLLKRLAADAGVHIYDHNPAHLLFANRHYLMIAADNDGGTADIRLPRPATVSDPVTRMTIGRRLDQFSIELRPKEVRLFLLE